GPRHRRTDQTSQIRSDDQRQNQMNETDKCSQDGDHHCPRMADALSDVRLPVIYSAKYREYGIVYIDGSVQMIYFCPWCAAKLPKPLGHEWFERIWAMGLEPEDPRVPEAMLTDQWWKEGKL
ncbi:MAG: DUF6980 family protein, partial [Pseudonocardiales bacterium]